MNLPPGISPDQLQRWILQEEVRQRLVRGFRRFPPVTTSLVAVAVAVHIVVGLDDWLSGRILYGEHGATLYDAFLGARSVEGLRLWGGRDFELVAAGEWWRLVSAMFLHADLLHLGLNMLALFGLGRLCEGVFGSGRFLGLFLLAGVAGSVLSQAGGVHLSVGASGGVFGLMGAGIVFGRRFRYQLPPGARQIFWRGLMPWVVLNIFIGLTVPRIDNLGHMGGLVGGALLALVLGSPVIPKGEGRAGTANMVIFLSMVLLGWTAANMLWNRLG